MDSRIFRLVYCSRNRIGGTFAEVNREVDRILAKSRSNNAALSVTGAMLYNANNFAQVLEGPADAVGAVFEKIQRDSRHSEVVVVESGFVESRLYGEWSMAFSGDRRQTPTDKAVAAFDAVFAGESDGSDRIVALLQELAHQDDDWVMVDVA